MAASRLTFALVDARLCGIGRRWCFGRSCDNGRSRVHDEDVCVFSSRVEVSLVDWMEEKVSRSSGSFYRAF